MYIVDTKNSRIDKSGEVIVTEQLQALIDQLPENGKLVISAGKYLTSSIFLKSNMKLVIKKGAELIATTNESKYPLIDTRVAGIEMEWYPAIINISDCENVTLSGRGIINGNGEYWWNKYWGADYKSGMRQEYDVRDLRWACDYDCMRPRNVLVSNSSKIKLTEFSSVKSGFWNIHVLYSSDIHIDDIQIKDNGQESPSTDGIDIDSSSNVLVEKCVISCRDDSVAIKSGRDTDGYEVSKPCTDVTVRDCRILEGMGMTIGSEISGGVENIRFENIEFIGTDCGIRIKSSNARKGYIRDVVARNIEMTNVMYAFNFNLNWNPAYSACKLPTGYNGLIPKHWNKLLKQFPPTVPNTIVENIVIENVRSRKSTNSPVSTRVFQIEGFEDQPITNLLFNNVQVEATEYGQISYVKNMQMVNCVISISGSNKPENDSYDNR